MQLRRGPALMVLASLAFTVMVALVKLARDDLSAFEVIFWRGMFSIPLAAWMARSTGIRIHNVRLFVLRAVLGFGAMTCFFTAAYGIGVTELSLISKLQPVIVALLAPLFLGRAERSGPLILVVLAAGLLGTWIILAPDFEWSIRVEYGLWALAAAGFSAAAHVTLRGLGRTEAPEALVFWFQIAVLALAVPAQWGYTGQLVDVPSGWTWLWVAGVGVCATLGQVWLSAAYKADRAAVVAAASYVSPVFAVFGDALIFWTIPGVNAFAGGALVVAAGLVLVFAPGTRSPETAPPG